MAPDLIPQAIRRADPYSDLPVAIRQYYSPAEYMCLSDAEKAALIQTETEPDPE